MICWYCHWGWPEQTSAIYERAASAIGEDALDYGSGHVVWSDENFDTENIESCIRDAELMGADPIEIAALKELLAVPESIRCCEPDEYDGRSPQNFPPPAGVRCIPR